MGFAVQLPVPGQPFSSEGVKVGNDIAAIAQWGNGHILGTDLDPNADIHASQLDADAQLPTGIVLPFAGRQAAPAGFAVCDGRVLTRANFPRGFDFATAEVAAGNPMWTVNAGAATFTVPNLTDRFVYASGSNPVGAAGGETTHVLTLAEAPAHVHGPQAGAVGIVQAVGAGQTAYIKGAGIAGDTGVVLGNTGTQGGGAAHNNMPPFVVVAFIVKV